MVTEPPTDSLSPGALTNTSSVNAAKSVDGRPVSFLFQGGVEPAVFFRIAHTCACAIQKNTAGSRD